MKVKFIIPNIDRPYYLWQQLVQIKHFRELGLEEDVIYPVDYWGKPSKILQSLIDSGNIKAKIIPIMDERKIGNYNASIKPWLLHRYFQDHPDDVDQVFFYVGCRCNLHKAI